MPTTTMDSRLESRKNSERENHEVWHNESGNESRFRSLGRVIFSTSRGLFMVLSRALSALLLATVAVVASVVEYYRSQANSETCGNAEYESDMNEDTCKGSESSRSISEIVQSGTNDDQEFEEMGSKCCGVKKLSKVEPNAEEMPLDSRTSRTASIASQNGGKVASGDVGEIIELDDFAGGKKRSEYDKGNDLGELDENCEDQPLLAKTGSEIVQKSNGKTDTGSDDELIPLMDGNDDSSISAMALDNTSVVAEVLIGSELTRHAGRAHDQNDEQADARDSTRSDDARATADDAPNTEEPETRIESEQSNLADSKIERGNLSYLKDVDPDSKEVEVLDHAQIDDFQRLRSVTCEKEPSMDSQERNNCDECRSVDIKCPNGYSQESTTPPIPQTEMAGDIGPIDTANEKETGPVCFSPTKSANNAEGDPSTEDTCNDGSENLSDGSSIKVPETSTVDHATKSIEDQLKDDDVCTDKTEITENHVSEEVPHNDEREPVLLNEGSGTGQTSVDDSCVKSDHDGRKYNEERSGPSEEQKSDSETQQTMDTELGNDVQEDDDSIKLPQPDTITENGHAREENPSENQCASSDMDDGGHAVSAAVPRMMTPSDDVIPTEECRDDDGSNDSEDSVAAEVSNVDGPETADEHSGDKTSREVQLEAVQNTELKQDSDTRVGEETICKEVKKIIAEEEEAGTVSTEDGFHGDHSRVSGAAEPEIGTDHPDVKDGADEEAKMSDVESEDLGQEEKDGTGCCSTNDNAADDQVDHRQQMHETENEMESSVGSESAAKEPAKTETGENEEKTTGDHSLVADVGRDDAEDDQILPENMIKDSEQSLDSANVGQSISSTAPATELADELPPTPDGQSAAILPTTELMSTPEVEADNDSENLREESVTEESVSASVDNESSVIDDQSRPVDTVSTAAGDESDSPPDQGEFAEDESQITTVTVEENQPGEVEIFSEVTEVGIESEPVVDSPTEVQPSQTCDDVCSADAQEPEAEPINEVLSARPLQETPPAEVRETGAVPTIEVWAASETQSTGSDEEPAEDEDPSPPTDEAAAGTADESDAMRDVEGSTADEGQSTAESQPVDELPTAKVSDSVSTQNQDLPTADENQQRADDESTAQAAESEFVLSLETPSTDGGKLTAEENMHQPTEQMSTAEESEAGPSIEESIVNDILQAAVEMVTVENASKTGEIQSGQFQGVPGEESGDIEASSDDVSKSDGETPATEVSTVDDESQSQSAGEISSSPVHESKSPTDELSSTSNVRETVPTTETAAADECPPPSDESDEVSPKEMNETETTSVSESPDEDSSQEAVADDSSEVKVDESASTAVHQESTADENQSSINVLDERPSQPADADVDETQPVVDTTEAGGTQGMEGCNAASMATSEGQPISDDEIPTGKTGYEKGEIREGLETTKDGENSSVCKIDDGDDEHSKEAPTTFSPGTEIAIEVDSACKTDNATEFQNPKEIVCKEGENGWRVNQGKRPSLEIKEDGFVMVITSADEMDESDPVRKGDIVKPVLVKNTDHNPRSVDDETVHGLPETKETADNATENSEDKTVGRTGGEGTEVSPPITDDQTKEITNLDNPVVDGQFEGDRKVEDGPEEVSENTVQKLDTENENLNPESERTKSDKRVTIQLVGQAETSSKNLAGDTIADPGALSEDDRPPVFLDFELVTMDREDEGDTEDDATQKIGPMTVKSHRCRGSELSGGGREEAPAALFGTSPSGYDSDVEGSSQPEAYDDDTKKRRRKPRKKKETAPHDEKAASPRKVVSVETEVREPGRDEGMEQTDHAKSGSKKPAAQKHGSHRRGSDERCKMKTSISREEECDIGVTATHIRREEDTRSPQRYPSAGTGKENKIVNKERQKDGATCSSERKPKDKSKIDREKSTSKSSPDSKQRQQKKHGDTGKNENRAKKETPDPERSFQKASGRKKTSRGEASAAGDEKPQALSFDSGGQGDARARGHSSDSKVRNNAVRALARFQQGKSPTPVPKAQPQPVADEMGVPVESRAAPENDSTGAKKKRKKKKPKSSASTPSTTRTGKVENVSVGVQVDGFGDGVKKRVAVCDSAIQVSLDDDDLTSEMSEDRATVDSELSACKGSLQKDMGGPYVTEFPYPANSIPKLIGRKGKNIRQIANRTNTVIKNRPSDVKEFHTIRVEAENPKQLWIAMQAIQSSPRRD